MTNYWVDNKTLTEMWAIAKRGEFVTDGLRKTGPKVRRAIMLEIFRRTIEREMKAQQ